MQIVEASGPRPARILIVGEAPGVEEELKGAPFVGASGRFLDEILAEVGIDRYQCRVTNVCQVRPPRNKIEEFFYNKTEAKQNGAPLLMGCYCSPAIIDGLKELEREVRVTNPDMIIALGNVAMWACTGLGGSTGSKVRKKNEKAPSGIRLWRGSQLTSRWGQRLVPTYHPAYILRNWETNYAA
jgi:DNA polymerase